MTFIRQFIYNGHTYEKGEDATHLPQQVQEALKQRGIVKPRPKPKPAQTNAKDKK